MNPVSTLARVARVVFLGVALGGCGLRVVDIAEPDPSLPPDARLPRYSSSEPMPECGKGWRQDVPVIGTMECSKPFVIEVPDAYKEPPPRKLPPLFRPKQLAIY